MKCPICGSAELVHDTRDKSYTYKGESTIIPSVTGDFCPACGEVVLEKSESARISSLMLEFNKQVNASIVDPAFITRVRKKLSIDQREAGEIFGGGVNAFSRYEIWAGEVGMSNLSEAKSPQNSNIKAAALSFGKGGEAMKPFENALENLIQKVRLWSGLDG